MKANKTNQGTVLVTGASRGLGKSATLKLRDHGYKVFAGIRNPKDGDFYSENYPYEIIPVQLDVTQADSIAAAYEKIAAEVGDIGLAGLINNAGIAMFGPVEQIPIDEVEQQFKVNVYGVIAVTQQFLPLLRKAKGRVINISSINGELSIPTSGVYSASKFALEAISDALRMEVKPWDIHVSVIQPGVTSTDIRTSSMEQWGNRQEGLAEAHKALYGELYAKTCALLDNMEKSAADHEDFTNCVLEAMTANQPFARKMSGPDTQQWEGIISMPEDQRDETLLGFWA